MTTLSAVHRQGKHACRTDVGLRGAKPTDGLRLRGTVFDVVVE